MPDTNSITLAVAAFLFVIALVALAIWAFESFVLGGTARSGPGFLRQRDRRWAWSKPPSSTGAAS